MNNRDEQLRYQLALTKIEGVGEKYGRRLLSEIGDVAQIFKASRKQLMSIEGLGAKRIEAIKHEPDWASIDKEINFIVKHDIRPIFITEAEYPKLLKECGDAPLLLFFKGKPCYNETRNVAIVGTRHNSEYGQRATEELIEGLRSLNVCVISGLAYGIDIIAHRKALQCGLPTVGVVAHGLDRMYPSVHKATAKEMTALGGIMTEYPSGTVAEKQNFPMRNRIVAGMAHVTVVVETDVKGGAMITAKLAAGYNRDVAAIPGRTTDPKSNGCNYLIRTKIADLINTAQDLAELMDWQATQATMSLQTRLFPSLTKEELNIVKIIEGNESMHVDEIMLKSKMASTSLASLLLQLELQNVVKSLPGKRYALQ
jgi:DNA processing protein